MGQDFLRTVVGGVQFVVRWSIVTGNPNIFSRAMKFVLRFQVNPLLFLADSGNSNIPTTAVARGLFILRLEGIGYLLRGDEVQRPNLLIGFQIVTSKRAAVKKD